jgi:hypothetical protein
LNGQNEVAEKHTNTDVEEKIKYRNEKLKRGKWMGGCSRKKRWRRKM